MDKLYLCYTSISGSSCTIVEKVSKMLLEHNVILINMKESEPEVIARGSNFIFCAPTYGDGELDRYTRSFLEQCNERMWQDKHVYLIGLGDQVLHGSTFAGCLWHLENYFLRRKAILNGRWPATGYKFKASCALGVNNDFPGLVIDEVNQSNLTSSRLTTWLINIGLISKEDCNKITVKTASE